MLSQTDLNWAKRSTASRLLNANPVGFPELPQIRPADGERGAFVDRLAELELGEEEASEGKEEEGAAHRPMDKRYDRLEKRYVSFNRRGWLAFRLKDYVRAAALFDAARSVADDRPHAEVGRFCTAFADGRYHTAVKYLMNLVGSTDYELDPMLANFDLRTMYANPADLEAGVRSLAAMVIENPGHSGLNSAQAMIEWLRGQRTEGRVIARRVAAAGPNDAWARLSMAMERVILAEPSQPPAEAAAP